MYQHRKFQLCFVSIFSLLTGAAVKIQYLRRKEKYALFTGSLDSIRKK
jgi:hypothetical protein